MDAVAQLCPACGMCCNGVLFGDVELQRGDDAKRLTTLGLDLFRKGRKECFSQPCACFDGTLCQIYDGRPKRCRTFECRLLQRVQAGKVATTEALKVIKVARGHVGSVRKLIGELGQTNERMPLNMRYASVMAEPINLAEGEAVSRRRGKLMQAVGALAEVLERDFLV